MTKIRTKRTTIIFKASEDQTIVSQEALDLINNGYTIDTFRPATNEKDGVITATKVILE